MFPIFHCLGYFYQALLPTASTQHSIYIKLCTCTDAFNRKGIQVRSKRVFPKVLTQKGIAIADFMWTLGHCQHTGENLKILRVDAKHLGSGPIPGWTKIIPNSDITHYYFP